MHFWLAQECFSRKLLRSHFWESVAFVVKACMIWNAVDELRATTVRVVAVTKFVKSLKAAAISFYISSASYGGWQVNRVGGNHGGITALRPPGRILADWPNRFLPSNDAFTPNGVVR